MWNEINQIETIGLKPVGLPQVRNRPRTVVQGFSPYEHGYMDVGLKRGREGSHQKRGARLVPKGDGRHLRELELGRSPDRHLRAEGWPSSFKNG